ncbi:disease resistance-like protein DSC1 [Punica granatum]|uniref:Disease resistance-like protein DSC1 n=1 Tax=Punica granatum TaxID=22663 RepID=A0A6P8CU58_PUNGR|nr:disease resistance-like protein DSC1 [Punica granatum]
MKRLRLFITRNLYHCGEPICFPNRLKWLEWPKYTLNFLPFSSGGQKNLRALYLSKSSIRFLAEDFERFRNLKYIDFSYCGLLHKIPDVSTLKNLERLDLSECKSLVSVHQSLGFLDKLVHLNFSNCCKLRKFPRSLNSKLLQSLVLKENPDASLLLAFSKLIYLDLHGCRLTEVNFLKDLQRHSTLTILILSGNKLVSLPSDIRKFSALDQPDLSNCKQLQEIVDLPPNIKILQAAGCESLESFPSFSGALKSRRKASIRIDLSGGHKLNKCSDIANTPPLEELFGTTVISIIHPGSEVPNWFEYQSTERHVSFSVSPERCMDIVGVAFCAAAALDKQGDADVYCKIQLSFNKQYIGSGVESFPASKSAQLWLLFIPLSCLDPELVSYGCNQSEVLFEVSRSVLQSCGVHLVFHQGSEGRPYFICSYCKKVLEVEDGMTNGFGGRRWNESITPVISRIWKHKWFWREKME